MTQPEEGNWKLFCDDNPEICQLPADPFIIAVYFNNLLVSNGYRDDAAYYGIRCHHSTDQQIQQIKNSFSPLVVTMYRTPTNIKINICKQKTCFILCCSSNG